jgi:hypothetical protein
MNDNGTPNHAPEVGRIDNNVKVIVGTRWVSLNPSQDEIDIDDIIGNVCKIRRWNGAFGDWTVGMHTLAVLCCAELMVAPVEVRRALLLHDLHEAFTGDIIGPMKKINTILGAEIAAIENRIDAAIEKKLGVTITPSDKKDAKLVDSWICSYEASLFGHPNMVAHATERHGAIGTEPWTGTLLLAMRTLHGYDASYVAKHLMDALRQYNLVK